MINIEKNCNMGEIIPYDWDYSCQPIYETNVKTRWKIGISKNEYYSLSNLKYIYYEGFFIIRVMRINLG